MVMARLDVINLSPGTSVDHVQDLIERILARQRGKDNYRAIEILQ